ncbi:MULTISPECIES: nitroreductase family protein [Parabacteroides]|uniref:nitroreductase family protein n=1 Tax=Parabacteroides provencensis TaxID=1944636 RepID=UPI000C15C814|nr:nitroreductase family protein [Parabacteroides provencensis]
MNLLELIKKRCSIRNYSSSPVEDEKISYILEAARLAPSAVNYQPWYFLVVKEESGCRKLQECYPREWFKSANCFIVVCGDQSQSWKRNDGKNHMDIDAAIAAEHICLSATEQGLGSCWVCNFDTALCKKHFNIPETVEPIVIIPIGYPATPSLFDETPKKRKAIEETVKLETF